MDIKACLEAIAPYDIINKKVNKDTLDIIIDFLNTKASSSIDVENSYIGESQIIDMELVKIYLNDIYTILSSIQQNPNIIRALDNLAENYPKAKLINLITETADGIISTESGYGISFFTEQDLNSADGDGSIGGSIGSMSNETLKEYLYTAKAFKQRKGTLSALKYGYNIIRQSGVQEIGTTDAVTDTLFDIQYGTEENPNQPFYFRITGSLIPEVYENAVVPIVHPLGFGYEYVRLMKLAFLELDLVKEVQSNYDVKIICDNGAYQYNIDAEDIINIEKVYDDFGDVKITVFLKDTADIATGFNSTGYKIVRDYNSLVYLMDEFDEILIDYPDYCALFTNYDIKYISGIEETETVELHQTQWIEEVPTTDKSFDIETWCIEETYFITTEAGDEIITEQLDYHLYACSIDTETYDAYVVPMILSDGGSASDTFESTLDGGSASTFEST